MAKSLIVRIQYPQTIGPLSENKLDTFLRSLQQTQLLYEYECTLNTLMFPSGESIPADAPSLYCKRAPANVTTKTNDLDPLVLVELVFTVAVTAFEADAIVKTVDDLLHQHLLPEKSKVKTRILVTSLNSQKATFSAEELPLPYYQLHSHRESTRVNYIFVIMLVILWLGILLINFALHFHFQ